MRPTKKWFEALRWISEREPVGWFDQSGPTMTIVKRLVAHELIREAGDSRELIRVVRYELTAKGWDTLGSSKTGLGNEQRTLDWFVAQRQSLSARSVSREQRQSLRGQIRRPTRSH